MQKGGPRGQPVGTSFLSWDQSLWCHGRAVKLRIMLIENHQSNPTSHFIDEDWVPKEHKSLSTSHSWWTKIHAPEPRTSILDQGLIHFPEQKWLSSFACQDVLKWHPIPNSVINADIFSNAFPNLKETLLNCVTTTCEKAYS